MRNCAAAASAAQVNKKWLSTTQGNEALPDQILGFDSWSFHTTTNDAWASDVDAPEAKNETSLTSF